MSIKRVKVHKMFEEFNSFLDVEYIGEYNKEAQLVKLYNSLNEELIHIEGTYQWLLPSTGVTYFVETEYIS